MINNRKYCYTCNRPQSSCVCKLITTTNTHTKFILIMHPKEYKKTKNNTGKITKKSLQNCELYVGIDFNHNEKINKILDDKNNDCYVLYPDNEAINLNQKNIKSNKNIVIFIIDSTWACSKKILRLSTKLNQIPKISFSSNSKSIYGFKKQPNECCLSTIESTLCILRILNFHNIENIEKKDLDNFLNPFKKMIEYQTLRLKENKNIRIK